MNQLFPYQIEGVEWLKRQGNRLLAWEPGTGKTPTACMASEAIGARKILVLCPPIASGVWQRHFSDWTSLKPEVFTPRFMGKALSWARSPGVKIVPYSQISRLSPVVDALKDTVWDVCILDESHYLKGSRAARTRQVLGENFDLKRSVAGNASRVWCLTGTPVLNNASELWPMLHALAPDTIRAQNNRPLDEFLFTDRFCVTAPSAFGLRIVGSKRTDELARRLAPFMSRKRKRDVLKDLPPLLFSELVLPADTPLNPQAKRELQLLTGNFAALSDEDFLDALHAGTVQLATIRRILGEAKVAPVSELVDEMLAEDPSQKIIIFAHHRKVIQSLRENLEGHGVIVIDGSTSNVPRLQGNYLASERDRLIDRFQNDPGVHVAILQIIAAGTAATLTASSNVLFCEASWVPAENHQAVARAHRIGQTQPVLAQFVTLPGTIDERIQRVLAQKTKEIEQILDPV